MVVVERCVVHFDIDDTIYPLYFVKNVRPSIAMSVIRYEGTRGSRLVYRDEREIGKVGLGLSVATTR